MFHFQTKKRKKKKFFGLVLTCRSVPASQQLLWCFSQRRCTSFMSRSIKIHEHTQYTCFTQCVFIQEHVLDYGGGHYSHAVCQALKLPMTCRLTSQRPEEQQNTHMRTNSHICRATAWCFPDAAPSFSPSYTAWHSRPPKSPTPTPTHTHSTSHGSLNTAYQRFLLLQFPFSHAGTLHSSGGCSGCKGSLASCKRRKNIKMFVR